MSKTTPPKLRSFFILYRLSDGAVFPQSRRGQSKLEFACEEPPRLFLTRAAANACLRWWLQGVHFMRRSRGGSWDDYDESWDCEKRPERQPG